MTSFLVASLELLDPPAIGLGAAVVAGGAFESLLGLGQDLVDPGVDEAGLEAELFGQLGDGFFAGEVSADDLSLLFGGEATTFAGHGIFLRSGYANPTGDQFHFQLRLDKRRVERRLLLFELRPSRLKGRDQREAH